MHRVEESERKEETNKSVKKLIQSYKSEFNCFIYYSLLASRLKICSSSIGGTVSSRLVSSSCFVKFTVKGTSD